MLSLLIALFSVVGLSIPPIVGALRDQDAELHEAIVATRIGTLVYGTENMEALVVDLLITNSGKLPGVIKAVGVKLKGEKTWNFNTVLFDKQHDGASVTIAWTSAVIDLSQSRIIEVKHPFRRAYVRPTDFQLRIESFRFDLQTRSLELQGEIE